MYVHIMCTISTPDHIPWICRSYTGPWFPYIAATVYRHGSAIGPYQTCPLTIPQGGSISILILKLGRWFNPHGSIPKRSVPLQDLQIWAPWKGIFSARLSVGPPGERPRNTWSDSPCETAASAGLRSARSAHCCPGDVGWGWSPQDPLGMFWWVRSCKILQDV